MMIERGQMSKTKREMKTKSFPDLFLAFLSSKKLEIFGAILFCYFAVLFVL